MNRAVIYTRYSTDLQREESIHAQFRACREYCQRKGYDVVKEYADEAQSAKDDDRPAFQEMVSDAKQKHFDVIVYHKLDRSSRHEYYFYFYKMLFQKLNIRQEYTDLEISNSPDGQFFEGLMISVAAWQRRNIRREVLKGMNENAHNAKFNGGVPALGYDIDTNGKYVINEYEAQAVRLIFNMYLADKGYSQIIEALSAKGFLTKRTKPFNKNSISGILKNPKYMGIYQYGKVRTREDGTRNSSSTANDMIIKENAVPAILTKQEALAVMNKRERNQKEFRSYNVSSIGEGKYLLAGILLCGYCNSALVGKTTRTRGTVYKYYICNGKHRQMDKECPTVSINAYELEAAILDKVKEEFFSAGRAKIIAEKLNKEYEVRYAKSQNARKPLQDKLQSAEARLDNLYKVIEAGGADEFDLQRLSDVKNEIRNIKAEIKQIDYIEQSTLTAAQVQNIISRFQSATNKKDPDAIRVIISNFVDRVTITHETVSIRYKINFCDEVGAGEGT